MLAAINFFGNVLTNETGSSGTDIFASPSAQAVTDITIGQFCMCVGAALVIGFLISLVYLFCHSVYRLCNGGRCCLRYRIYWICRSIFCGAWRCDVCTVRDEFRRLQDKTYDA